MTYVRVIRYEIEVDDETLEELEEKNKILEYYSDFSDKELEYEGADIEVLKEYVLED